MKKALSLLLAMIMLVSAMGTASLSTYADDNAVANESGELVLGEVYNADIRYGVTVSDGFYFESSDSIPGYTLTYCAEATGYYTLDATCEHGDTFSLDDESGMALEATDGMYRLVKGNTYRLSIYPNEAALNRFVDEINDTDGEYLYEEKHAITLNAVKTSADYNGLTFAIADDCVIITGYEGSSLSVEVPEEIMGRPVVGIGDYAFAGCYDMQSVTLPDSVKAIGDCAFMLCLNIYEMDIPEATVSIGLGAFCGCFLLDNLIIRNDNCEIATEGVIGFGGDAAYVTNGCRLCTTQELLHLLEALSGEELEPDTADFFDYDGDGYISFDTIPTITAITARHGSTGQRYANEYNLSFNPLDEHTLVDVRIISEATCTASGLKECECTSCGYTTTVEIPMLNHTEGEAVRNRTAPTCTTNGSESEVHYCAACRQPVSTQTRVLPAEGHNYKTTIMRADLQTNGAIIVKCTKCNAIGSNTLIAKPASFSLSSSKYTYNGKERTPSVTVKDSAGKTLVKDRDYTLSYSDKRQNVGKHSVKITFRGNYKGSKTLYFVVNPKGTKISKITAAKKALTVKWDKQSVQADGYEIQYATNKAFTKGKKSLRVKPSATSKKLTKLKSGKKYYVRIRTYKKIGSTTYYSDWSGIKSATVKK